MSNVKGYPHGRWLRITTSYDPEQFEQIKAVAREQNCTFAEAVRLLIEWGLEAENVNEP